MHYLQPTISVIQRTKVLLMCHYAFVSIYSSHSTIYKILIPRKVWLYTIHKHSKPWTTTWSIRYVNLDQLKTMDYRLSLLDHAYIYVCVHICVCTYAWWRLWNSIETYKESSKRFPYVSPLTYLISFHSYHAFRCLHLMGF